MGYLISFKVQAVDAPIEINTKPKILWVSDKLSKNLDDAYKGFEYRLKNNAEIRFLNIQSDTFEIASNSLEGFDFIIASGDDAWEMITQHEDEIPKLGVGIEQSIINKHSQIGYRNHYLISKEQSPQRIFILLSELNLNHSQSAALFYKNQIKEKFEFSTEAKKAGLPFKPIFIEAEQNILKTMATVQDCCKVLYIKDSDFNSNNIKTKSALIESYRRRIITIGNRSDMLSIGAMYVIYTPEHQLGIQAANTITKWIDGQKIKPIQSPSNFVIESNPILRKIIGGNLINQSIGELTNKIKLIDSISEQDNTI